MSNSGISLSRTRIAVKLFLKYLLAPIGLVVRPSAGVRVLFYHRVNNHRFADLGLVSREISVPTERFARQMDSLARRGYRTLKLEEFQQMVAGEVPFDRKAVLITFDDGYLDNLEQAAPILALHGFTAVLFPVVTLIGKDNRVWPMSDPKGLGDFMQQSDLVAWQAAGNEIGSHTNTHPVLTSLGEVDLQQELAGSRLALETLLEAPCRTVAYPGGDVDARVSDAARKAGYEMGFTTRSGLNSIETSMHELRRTEVSVTDTQLIFILKMWGFFDWLGVRDTVAYRRLMRYLNGVMSSIAKVPETSPR